LADRNFRLLLLGQSVSELGSAMFPVALVALVTARHGGVSAAGLLGLLLGVRGIAEAAGGLFAGVVATRVRKTLMLVVNDAAQVAITVAFAFSGGGTAVLLVLSALSGAFASVVQPAGGSLLPLLLPADQLQRANATRAIGHRSAAIAGPAVAGVLIASAGIPAVFVVDAVTFVVSMATLLFIRERRQRTVAGPAGFRAGLRRGVGEVFRRPWVIAIIAVATVQAPLTIAPGFTLLPIVAEAHYRTSTYGLALSCMALGELLGGVIAARWTPRLPGLVSLAGCLPYPLVLLALAAVVPAPVVYAGYALVGVGFTVFGVYWYTALQREIPEETLGVVLGVDQVGSFGLQPIGYAVAGALANVIGAARVLVGAGVFGLVTTLIPLFVPGVARLSSAPGRAISRTAPTAGAPGS